MVLDLFAALRGLPTSLLRLTPRRLTPALQDGLARALKFTRYLAEIYHPYTNYKGVFRADNLMALWDRVAPAERRRYPFALHQIDWEDYLFNTHLPGIRKYGIRRHRPLSVPHTLGCLPDV